MAYEVHIIWGAYPEPGATPDCYSFETEAERSAFLLGVAEMDGWLGYEVVDGPNCRVSDDHEIVEVKS